MGGGIKFENGIIIGKKANKTVTTPSSSWKTVNFHNNPFDLDPNFSMKACVSARTIGANLWEAEPQFNFNKNDADHHHDADHDGGLIHQRRRRHRKEGFMVSDQSNEEPSYTDSHPPPEIQTSLRRNIRGLPSKHHLSAGKNDQDLHHVSSASCCSSMQVTPYACAVTPTGYTLKTSRHLLKVLNRIWNLEEQNLLNVTLIKSLKHDLDISRAQIKTLVEERKNDHQEIDELKKSTQERKNKAVQSTRDEMLDMKSSFMREKKARILLESLCDEFAKGIRDYEQKVRFLQQNRGRKDQIVCKNEPDRLILHVSEAWLDERVQMKRQFSDKTSISDDLCSEIETFLEAKKKLSQGIGVENEDIIGKHEEIKSFGGITEPSPLLVSRMMDRGPGPAESSAHSMSRRMDRRPAVTEPTSRRAPDREEVKRNTLMAQLLEARLESQFAKSKTVRKVV